jgi:hypothetical protein
MPLLDEATAAKQHRTKVPQAQQSFVQASWDNELDSMPERDMSATGGGTAAAVAVRSTQPHLKHSSSGALADEHDMSDVESTASTATAYTQQAKVIGVLK